MLWKPAVVLKTNSTVCWIASRINNSFRRALFWRLYLVVSRFSCLFRVFTSVISICGYLCNACTVIITRASPSFRQRIENNMNGALAVCWYCTCTRVSAPVCSSRAILFSIATVIVGGVAVSVHYRIKRRRRSVDLIDSFIVGGKYEMHITGIGSDKSHSVIVITVASTPECCMSEATGAMEFAHTNQDNKQNNQCPKRWPGTGRDYRQSVQLPWPGSFINRSNRCWHNHILNKRVIVNGVNNKNTKITIMHAWTYLHRIPVPQKD